MNTLALALAAVLATQSPAPAPADGQWWGYVAKNKRMAMLKRSAKGSGLGAALATNSMGAAYWVTADLARALVSQMIDSKRLTPERAELEYASLRPEGKHAFIIQVAYLGSRGGIGVVSANQALHPIRGDEVFLQRKGDRAAFTRGEIEAESRDFSVGAAVMENSYMVRFPRMTEDGAPLIRNLDERVEIHFSMSGKDVVLAYKVRDLAASLDAL